MTTKTQKQPLIGTGLESVIALTFAAGMFALALLHPVYSLWLPL